MKTLYYYHGFMGQPGELDFLKDDFNVIGMDTVSPPPLPSNLEDTILYGYSMGGRKLLKQLSQTNQRGDVLILESVQLFNLSEKERKERLDLDHKRARSITENFPQFLLDWYSAPLWQFNYTEKKKMIALQKERWQGKEAELAKTIIENSPGHFILPEDLGPIFQKFKRVLYLYGKIDQKYLQTAREIREFYPKVELRPFTGLGHNIHYQMPESILRTLKSL